MTMSISMLKMPNMLMYTLKNLLIPVSKTEFLNYVFEQFSSVIVVIFTKYKTMKNTISRDEMATKKI